MRSGDIKFVQKREVKGRDLDSLEESTYYALENENKDYLYSFNIENRDLEYVLFYLKKQIEEIDVL